MVTDPNRVKEIFLEAAEQPDETARAAYLDRACGGDAGLRDRVEALLRSHDPAGSFLGTPAAVVPDPIRDETMALDPISVSGSTRDGGGKPRPEQDEEPDDLKFLSPSTRPDSLGRLGHYEVLQVLGRGGFGIVFRAFDEMLQRVVAVKVMAPQIATLSPARKRFLREARSSAAVRHENVVQVYEVGEQPLPYLAMEFIPGETLQQKLDRCGPLDVPEVLRIGRQIAEGLAAAHACDLIHRDIKPGNVLLEGGSHKAKITDFGLARAADDASISQSGIIAGTPLYMAPEQAQGQPLDQRADLFSLGSVLYQMVAGRPPFRANNAVAVLKRVADDKPRAIREIIPETPQWLCDIIAKLHAKDPDDRYQSAREVADVLADCEAQLKANSKLKDYSRIPRSKPQRSGRRKWVAVAAAVLLPVIALIVAELAGVTHLFLGQSANSDPINNGSASAANPLTKQAEAESEGWVQLFNGKDLTGWKTHPDQPGDWKVEAGSIVGRGPKASQLFSNRGDFRDFHLRVETKLNAPGESSVFFRCPFGFPFAFSGTGLPGGFDADFQGDGTAIVAGQLNYFGPKPLLARVTVPPDTWFTYEILAAGDRIVLRVNGQTTADYRDPERRFTAGHIALQVYKPDTVVHFRKIEVKELPTAGSPTLAVAPFDAGQARKHQEAWAKHLGVPVEFTNSTGMKMRLIPAGGFTAGTAADDVVKLTDMMAALHISPDWISEVLREAPPVPARVPQPFYLGTCEVTIGQFRAFVAATKYETDGEKSKDGGWSNSPDGWRRHAEHIWKTPGPWQSEDTHPVVHVSWNDARAFCKWLSGQEGVVYTLPDERQWEFAARAGTTSLYGDAGNSLDSLSEFAWTRETQDRSGPHPVGSKKANPFGLFDMLGNASEWCLDPYPGVSGSRVVRGGAWYYPSVEVRPARRCKAAEGKAPDAGTGFRVAIVGDLKAKTQPLAADSPTDLIPFARPALSRGRWESHDGKLVHPARDSKGYPGLTLAVRGPDDFDLEAEFERTSGDDFIAFGMSSRGHLFCVALDTWGKWAGLQAVAGELSNVNPTRRMGPWLTTGRRHTFRCEVRASGVRAWLDAREVVDYRGGYDVLAFGRPGLPDWAQFFVQADDKCGFVVHKLVLTPRLLGPPPAPFTDADVQRIAALPAGEQVEEVRKELKRLNPGFDGTLTPTIDNGVVTGLKFNTDEVVNIAPVRALKGLTNLDCRGTYLDKGKLSDLSPLKGMALTRLDCSSTQVSELTPLAGMPLTILHFNHNPVSDLTPLKGMPLLVLGCAQTKVSDLSPLKDMKLKELWLMILPVSDLTPLQGMPLKALDLYATRGATNLEPLKGMPLEHLNLSDVPVSDISALKGMTSLRSLHLAGNALSDLTPLQGLKLRDLVILDKQVSDLSPLKGMPLKRLVIYGIGVSDLKPLKGMELEEIRFTPRDITQGLDILRDMKSLKTIGIMHNQAWPAAEFWERYDKGEFTK